MAHFHIEILFSCEICGPPPFKRAVRAVAVSNNMQVCISATKHSEKRLKILGILFAVSNTASPHMTLSTTYLLLVRVAILTPHVFF